MTGAPPKRVQEAPLRPSTSAECWRSAIPDGYPFRPGRATTPRAVAATKEGAPLNGARHDGRGCRASRGGRRRRSTSTKPSIGRAPLAGRVALFGSLLRSVRGLHDEARLDVATGAASLARGRPLDLCAVRLRFCFHLDDIAARPRFNSATSAGSNKPKDIAHSAYSYSPRSFLPTAPGNSALVKARHRPQACFAEGNPSTLV